MTIRRAAAGGSRLRTIIAGVGSLAVLVAVVLMLWPPESGDDGFTAGRGESDGETVGWVSKVESNTIHVNSGPFGGGVVPLVVTKATRIRVGTKDGWFENIRPGGQVKVAYELYHGRRFARTVELLVDEAPRRPVRALPQLKGTASATPNTERAATPAPGPDARSAPVPAPESSSAKPWSVGAAPRPVPGLAKPATPAGGAAAPAPVGRTTDPAVKPPAPAAPVVSPPAAPAAVVAKPAAPTPPQARPAPRAETPAIPAPSRSQPVESVPASPAPTRQVSAPDTGSRIPDPVRASETPRPAAAPRPAEPARSTGGGGEGADGSAAVDWLLQNRR